MISTLPAIVSGGWPNYRTRRFSVEKSNFTAFL